MSNRGYYRDGEVIYMSDDEDSIYDDIIRGQPSHHRSRSRLKVHVQTDDRKPSPARVAERQKIYHHNSYAAPQSAAEPDNIRIVNHLNVPQQYRPRASSQGASPQPNFIPIYVPQPERESSRERVKHYHYRRHYSDESEDDSSYRSSSRQGRRYRRKSSPRNDNNLPPEVVKRLAKLELLESQKESISPATAEKLYRLRMYEEQQRHDHKPVDPAVQEKLHRLKAMEEKKSRDEEEAAIIARIDERKKKEKQREEALLLEYQEHKRQEEEAEREAFAKAEAKRQKKEDQAKAERERLLLQANEKAAKDKAERQRIIAEEKEKQERYKKEAEEERKRILSEEEERRKKEKEKHEELRKRILAEEEEKDAKEKAKKKKEEEDFNQKVKEKFMKAGYSPDYIEDIIKEKKDQLVRKSSTRTGENRLAIDVSRPTYIRVQLRYLYPETLDTYRLPWEVDPTDDKYILIKEYVSHELQQELFEHTKKIKLRREKLLITDGLVKETVTTLKPRDVYKDKGSDDMFVVRRKSTTSKSPARRSWMFT